MTTNTDVKKGAALKRRRLEQGLRQDDLAQRIQYSRYQVAKWEIGTQWPQKKEGLLTEELEIENRNFFGAIGEGVSYEDALLGRGSPTNYTLTRKEEDPGYQSIEDRLSYLLDLSANDYSDPVLVGRVVNDLRGRVDLLIRRAYADLGINDRNETTL
jgi:transcriptional regulator with XRE-family HTH domain